MKCVCSQQTRCGWVYSIFSTRILSLQHVLWKDPEITGRNPLCRTVPRVNKPVPEVTMSWQVVGQCWQCCYPYSACHCVTFVDVVIPVVCVCCCLRQYNENRQSVIVTKPDFCLVCFDELVNLETLSWLFCVNLSMSYVLLMSSCNAKSKGTVWHRPVNCTIPKMSQLSRYIHFLPPRYESVRECVKNV